MVFARLLFQNGAGNCNSHLLFLGKLLGSQLRGELVNTTLYHQSSMASEWSPEGFFHC